MGANIKAIETVYNGYRFRSRVEARWAVFFDTLAVKYEYEKQGYDVGEGIWYLCDFYLPDYECWIEIKGQQPSEAEQHTCGLLAAHTGQWVDLVWGAPWSGEYHIFAFRSALPSDRVMWYVEQAFDRDDEYILQTLMRAWPRTYWEPVLTRYEAKWGRNPKCGAALSYFQGSRQFELCPGCKRLQFGYSARTVVERELVYFDTDADGNELEAYGEVSHDFPAHWAWCSYCDQPSTSDHPLLLRAFEAARQARFEHGERGL